MMKVARHRQSDSARTIRDSNHREIYQIHKCYIYIYIPLLLSEGISLYTICFAIITYLFNKWY